MSSRRQRRAEAAPAIPATSAPAAETAVLDADSDADPVGGSAAGDDTLGAAAGDDTINAAGGADSVASAIDDDTLDASGADDDSEMVEVILTVSMAGAECKAPGDTHRCSPAEAKRLRDAGFAEPEA
ncbi:hypothetical protein GG804_14130 [Sphingomonas histidinilytica]|uniref:hypothetical protein n=1 Tax=Rhizorhabdus histidinilytica TaxID=439228 RepID=UPI001ADCFCE3|nr:hypothetical protein [Rhizorhabdus histidinilytica]MBO9377908.1 hypothetical protein [Rhizorhabdus histidinilytica]